MKKFLGAFLVFTIILTMSPAIYAFDGGTGGAGSPYQISTPEQLLTVCNNPSANYVLTNDIDLSSINFNSIGDSNNMFSGNFNGAGFSILNLDSSLFGVISGIVDSLTIVNSTVQGETNVGILASENQGTISNCAVISGSASANNCAGGIVGYNNGGRIINSYSTSIVKNSNIAGGIAGKSTNGEITNCYAAGEFSSNSGEVGGIVGISTGSSITGCYYDTDITKMFSGTGVGSDSSTGLTTADMKKMSSYAGWDFGSSWSISDGNTHPYHSRNKGTGSISNPYKIRTAKDFSEIQFLGLGDQGTDKYFELMNDISGSGLYTIGDENNPFTGHLNGNYNRINSYSIRSGNYQGLFSYIAQGASVTNLSVTIGSSAASDVTGGIASKNDGTISSCNIFGSLSGSGKDIGGITGENTGLIENCRVSADVTGSSTGIGGIAGYNNGGTINSCYTDGIITGRNRTVGGIVGDNSFGIVSNCYTKGKVSGSQSEIGGIIGRNYQGTVKNCFANSSLGSGENKGGIIGSIIEGASIESCYFNYEKASTKIGIGSSNEEAYGISSIEIKSPATYSGWDFYNTWSIQQEMEHPILSAISGNGSKDNPYKINDDKDLALLSKTGLQSMPGRRYYKLMTSISIGNNTNIGTSENPFVGSFDGGGFTLSSSYPIFSYLGKNAYIGNVTVNCSYNKSGAGLAKNSDGAIIEHCYIIGSISGSETATGALIANAKASTINNCGAAVSISGSNNTGGLIGHSANGTVVTNSYSSSTVNGSNNTGGLIGNNNNSNIEKSYAECNVAGVSSVGGLVGRNDNNSSISNSYSTSIVSENSYSAGFAGANYAKIDKCYSTASFTSINDGGTINNSYYVPSTQNADYAIPKSDYEMKMQETFTGWDFYSTWNIVQGQSYPYFIIKTSGKNIILNEPSGLTNEGNTSLFYDISGHWAEADITFLAKNNVINGYEDGSYRPEDTVTKAELIKLLLQAKKMVLASGQTPYADVNGHWAASHIYTAYQAGLLANINQDDTTFGVDSPISRAEASAIMGRMAGKQTNITLNFTDNDSIPDWAAIPVSECVRLGLIAGFPDGTFRGGDTLNRAEAATIVMRLMKL